MEYTLFFRQVRGHVIIGTVQEEAFLNLILNR